MLAIRMQRTGRKGHAQFRVIVQDSRWSPSTGKVVAHLGSYDPHTKEAKLDKEEAKRFLDNGAQPSNRVAKLFQSEKIDLPKWVSVDTSKKKETKNPEKYGEAEAAAPAEGDEAPAEEATEAPKEEAPAKEKTDDKPEEKAEAKEESKEEAPAEDKAEEKPAEEEKPETEEATDEKSDATDEKTESKE